MRITRDPKDVFAPFTIHIDVESDEDIQALNYITTAARGGMSPAASVPEANLRDNARRLCADLHIITNAKH